MKRLLTTVVVGLAGIQGVTLEAESRPKLVVGIVVDQLRTDYLETLKDMFGTGGFRRLMEQGLYLQDVDFKVPGGDATSATAIIQTGTYPRQNGVAGEKTIDAGTKGLKPIFTDEKYIGNFTSETYSPAALRVGTLTDALSVDEKGKTRIHSIAPDAGQAIVLAGHTGSSSFWINEETGKWSSSTYYTQPPTAIQNRNYSTPLISRVDTMKWMPLRAGEPYPYVSDKEIKEGFKYLFSRSDRDVFSLYKETPMVNSDITDVAIDYLTELNLGKTSEGTDVLNLGYTLAPYPLAGSDDYRYELEDSYLRLDKDLEKLLNGIDRQVGRDNVLVYLVGTGYFEEPQPDAGVYGLPGGTFSVKRALSLLNAFLSAKYGNGSYVDQYANGHIYLLKNVLEEKGLDEREVAKESRNFLVKMSGISNAYTLDDLMNPGIPELMEARRATDPKMAGDIILTFNSGWKVLDDSRFPTVEQKTRTTGYQTPGFILSENVKPERVSETVEAVSIAPTVADALRIRAPNASEGKRIRIKN